MVSLLCYSARETEFATESKNILKYFQESQAVVIPKVVVAGLSNSCV